jgi:uncharacterized protein YjiS (DUF1127 family)
MTSTTNHTYTTYTVPAPIANLGRRPLAGAPVRRVLALLAEAPERLRHYWAAYKTREQLNRLSDRELADIGIYREDIPMLARQKTLDEGIVRHGDIGELLARNDNELAALGLKRGELEDFRAGRVKFVRRHAVIEGGRR